MMKVLKVKRCRPKYFFHDDDEDEGDDDTATYHLYTLHERQSDCLVAGQAHHTGRSLRSGFQQGHHSLHAHPAALHRAHPITSVTHQLLRWVCELSFNYVVISSPSPGFCQRQKVFLLSGHGRGRWRGCQSPICQSPAVELSKTNVLNWGFV